MGNGELSNALPDHPLPHFQAREAVWLCIRDPSDLEKKEQEERTAICQARPTAETLDGLAQEFMQMIRHLKGERLDEWLTCVRASQILNDHHWYRASNRTKRQCSQVSPCSTILVLLKERSTHYNSSSA
jgi:hypothetical protein